MEALRKKTFKSGDHIKVTDIRPGLVNTAMAKGEGLFWVMPVEKVASQIIAAIRKQMSKAYVTKRWHVLAIINKNLPFHLYRLLQYYSCSVKKLFFPCSLFLHCRTI